MYRVFLKKIEFNIVSIFESQKEVLGNSKEQKLHFFKITESTVRTKVSGAVVNLKQEQNLI